MVLTENHWKIGNIVIEKVIFDETSRNPVHDDQVVTVQFYQYVNYLDICFFKNVVIFN